MFSFGIEPSITSTNGASSSPRTAWRKGSRNSSPPSVGDSTLLWRWTFGIPGIAPSSTSSIPGWPAAVTETESPSQLIPSEIQRMWTSCTPTGSSATAMRDLLFLHVQRLDEQLLPAHDPHVGGTARGAQQREAVEHALYPALPAASGGGDHVQHQLGTLDRGALGDQLEGERQRRRHDLPQVPDRHFDPAHRAPARVADGDVHDALGDRQLVHQWRLLWPAVDPRVSGVAGGATSKSSAVGRRRAGP